MPREKSNSLSAHGFLGGPRDDMGPLVRYFAASAIPITELLSKEKIDRIMERTRKTDGEIVSLLKTCSAFYPPYLRAVAMAEANLKDKKRIFPCCVYLEGIVFNEKQEIKYWEEWSAPVEASILKGKIGNQTLFMN
jgi:malate/lactate dehydrogenase